MLITQSNSVDTGSVLDALRYCGKQLCRSLVVAAYFCMFVLFGDFAVFVTYQIHPEWEAQYEAEVDAKFAAMEDAEMIRLAAERKHERILAVKRAKHEEFLEAKRLKHESYLAAKRESLLEAEHASNTQ